MDRLLANILETNKMSVAYRYPLHKITRLGVGGIADIFFKPINLQNLINFLKILPANYPITYIGSGSNILIKDSGIRGVVIKLTSKFAKVTYDGKHITVGGAALNYSLTQFALQNSVANLEFLCGIPGSIGGSVFMNAGCYGWEMKDIISEVTLLDKYGNLTILQNNEINFNYRTSNLPKDLLVIEAKIIAKKGDFDSVKKRMEQITTERSISQPYTAKTAGSTFMNPPNHKAWQLIESVGLRGFKIGDASFSEKHCNFLINHGNATAQNFEDLINLAIKKVKEKYNIELILEVKILGNYEQHQ